MIAPILIDVNVKTTPRERAALDDTGAMVDLAHWLRLRGRHSEARQWLLNAAEAGDRTGMTRLAAALVQEGDLSGAEGWLVRATEAGDAQAMANLGVLRADFEARWSGRRKGGLIAYVLPGRSSRDRPARDWWRQAAEAGNAYGMFLWSVACAEMGRPEDSARWRQAAADSADPAVLLAIGDYCRDHHPGEAEQWYVRAVSADGDRLERANAAARLGELLGSDQAERRLREAAATIGAYGWGVLAEWLERRGRTEGEAWLRKAVDKGSINASGNLAVVQEQQGRTAEAEQLYERAARAGHVRSMGSLAWLLDQRGDLVAAAPWYRRAAAEGDSRAMSNLGWLLERGGDHKEAERWFLKAAEAGDAEAMCNLGGMYGRRGDEQLAYHWYAKAANAGSTEAVGKIARR